MEENKKKTDVTKITMIMLVIIIIGLMVGLGVYFIVKGNETAKQENTVVETKNENKVVENTTKTST